MWPTQCQYSTDEFELLLLEAHPPLLPANEETGESSIWAPGRTASSLRPVTSAKHDCVACLDICETVQVPCQHHYCKPCVLKLINDAKRSMTRSSHHDAVAKKCQCRCFGLTYITADLATRWEQKAIEFGTSCRTYCYSNPTQLLKWDGLEKWGWDFRTFRLLLKSFDRGPRLERKLHIKVSLYR